MKILYSPQTISNRVSELATAISRDYDSLVIIVILNGAILFAADLVRELSIPIELDTLSVKSYDGTQAGDITFYKDIQIDIKDKHVLFLEDIIDTGNTMTYLFKLFEKRGAASVKLCSFLKKPKAKVNIDYLGFSIPDLFVVGYGLDYNEKYRELPCVGVIE